MNILPARAYAKNLLDFISKASKRRIEWRGDWYRKVDGKTRITRMDDHVGDLIEQYVQARIANSEATKAAEWIVRMFGDTPADEFAVQVAEDPSTLTHAVELARAAIGKATGTEERGG